MAEETPLEKAHRVMAEKRANGEVLRKDPIEKARDNPKSLRLAVNAKCYDCVGAGADPSPRKEIGRCPSTGCPLHPVRPFQKYASLSEYENSQENGTDGADMGDDPYEDELI